MSKNNTPTQKTKHKVWPLVLILLVLVAAAAVAVGVMGKDKEEEQPEPETVQEEDSGLEEGQVVYNGVTYEYNKELETLLFLGVDKQEANLPSTAPAGAGRQTVSCCSSWILSSRPSLPCRYPEIPW